MAIEAIIATTPPIGFWQPWGDYCHRPGQLASGSPGATIATAPGDWLLAALVLGPVFDCLIRIRVFSRSNVFGSIPPPPHCLIQPSVGPLRMFTCTG